MKKRLILIAAAIILNSQFSILNSQTAWVDSLVADMTLQQQVAQLMVIRVPLNMDEKAQTDFEHLVTDNEVGGICFFVGTARETLPLIRRYQAASCIPLFICIDAEWGTGMRLKDCYAFPKNNSFGMLPPTMDTLVYLMGEQIGRECRNMGIHINFAPVVDINSNPRNPVIGPRSFGTDPERVAALGIQYMQGLQSQGVMAVAKHFPGHGDTETDSHFDLPVINHTREYMDTVDLLPFRRLIDAGVQGVMTAHLQVNAYEPEPNHPSSLSANIVQGLLRNQLHFDGLVITDGLDMKGVTKYYPAGQAELQALLAGSDILLLPPDVETAIETICRAAEKDTLLQELIEMRCRRVLRAKYNHGLAHLDTAAWHVPDSGDFERDGDIVRALRVATESRIDSIVLDGIARHAYPGCQVVAMHDGNILFRKAYGHLTYDTALSGKVTMQTTYDLASVTKMMATTLAVMKLVETGKVRLDDPLSRYLPYLKHSNKERITLRQTLSHMARLKAFDAYWKEAGREAAAASSNPYLSVIEQIIDSPLNPDAGYLYSDLGFILLGDLVEHVSGQRLDIFVEKHFYEPMGLCNTHFLPLENGVDTLLIAPTELAANSPAHSHIGATRAPTSVDTLAHSHIQGYVHDPNAFVMGGVSGHAGLFSTADDIAQILQMLVDGGMYKGRRYLREETIDLFNTQHYKESGCRRGLGFDKPVLKTGGGPCCDEAPQESYGHTGFTGTYVWVDPVNRLTYVFLSNRVHPSATPNRLAQMNIRTKIQSELYRFLKEGDNDKDNKENKTATFGQ
ncbi:MAG: serine hydrolase [Bacteroidales bacterium]|nr:serine hydrolase [Bacteroidales bacterium]